jgi:hypothetical protein
VIQRSTYAILLGWVVLIVGARTAEAQKAPQLGYMYPPVLKVGETNQVQLGGYDLTPDLQWFFHQTGVSFREATVPGDFLITPPPYWNGPRMSVASPLIAREVSATIEVSPDVPLGLGYFQTANANGISQTAPYLVRRGDEVAESRWRDDVQELASIPIGVSGRLRRLTEVDRFRFRATKDGLVHIDLHARRLGSNFNAMIKVEDEQGVCLVDVADTLGTDLQVVFAVKRDSQYTLSLHDADFRGDASFVYHLAIDDQPKAVRCFPSSVMRGTQTEVDIYGWGVASGKPCLESVRRSINVPADWSGDVWLERFETALGSVEVTLPIVATAVPRADVAPRSEVSGAFELTTVFQATEKEQRYRWQVSAGTNWQVESQAILFGSELDLELQLLDATGKVVASSEDSLGTTDPLLRYRSEQDTELTLVVRRLTQCDKAELNRYILSARPQASNFRLTLEQALSVAVGGKRAWIIKAERFGGHDAEIALDVAGLPEGVTLQGEKKIASGQSEVKWTLEVAPNVKVTAASLSVIGESIAEGNVVRSEALATISKSLAPLKFADVHVNRALLAITLTPPYDIFLLDKTRQRDTPRGATCVAEMDVVRKEGFDGEVLIEMAAQQSRYLCGSYGLSVKVPAGVKRIEYGAWMSEWLGTEYTMRMATHGVAQVADPQGNLRYVVKATDAPVTMIMEGALLKLAPERTIVTAKLGERVVVPVKISRSPKFSEAVEVDFELPTELRNLCQTSTLTLNANEVTGELMFDVPSDSRLLGTWTIPIHAVSHTKHWPIQAFSEFELRVQ